MVLADYISNMARPLRIEFEGAVYHVTSRGNAREDIYLSDEDRIMFLDVLSYVVKRHEWICHAYCLMTNHYHLMIETPNKNLSRGMSQLNGMYTQRFNRKHERVGHVFQGRFKSIIVDKEEYLLELSRYIVRNPVAASIVNHVEDWPWSSYQATVGNIEVPEFLRTDWLLSQFGTVDEYVDFVAIKDVASPWRLLNGPDVLGSDEFRKLLQKKAGGVRAGIPRKKYLLRHLPLSDIACESSSRSQWMWEAYHEHGYTMQAISDFANLHNSTVSRLIKQECDNAKNKP